MKLLFLLFRGYQFMINNLNPNFGTNQIAPFKGIQFKKKQGCCETCIIGEGSEENVKIVAFKASSGVVVSNFFHIYLKKDPWVSWNARKTELS